MPSQSSNSNSNGNGGYSVTSSGTNSQVCILSATHKCDTTHCTITTPKSTNPLPTALL
jgi:hypothetical protein